MRLYWFERNMLVLPHNRFFFFFCNPHRARRSRFLLSTFVDNSFEFGLAFDALCMVSQCHVSLEGRFSGRGLDRSAIV